jgi:hypothetical protein
MLGILHGLTFRVGQPVEHLWRCFPGEFSVGAEVPHRIARLFELGEDLGDEACLPLGDVEALLCSHATSTQNFSFLVIRNLMCSFVPATESLSQISVLRVGRPRHAPVIRIATFH